MAATDVSSWIEVFHHAPLWSKTRIVYSADGGTWISSQNAELMSDADHVMNGYRVFRVKAKSLDFVLCDGAREHWDNNNGMNYSIRCSGAYIASPDCGGYESGHEQNVGVKRIRDADLNACENTISVANKFIELVYESSPLWLHCYAVYATVDDSKWTPAPGVQMARYGAEAGHWFLRVEAPQMTVCFTDGEKLWDNYGGQNYRLSSPGKYRLSTSQAPKYLGDSDFDAHRKELISLQKSRQ
mmetsp:Transcript_12792/g.23003  ORF Transcript_12792/g.23003 Transcript_12792/m.23003 type:complete len:242 (-) Transcript_12792:1498-2223(-)